MRELPNAAPIRLLAVPDSAPPYDGSPPGAACPALPHPAAAQPGGAQSALPQPEAHYDGAPPLEDTATRSGLTGTRTLAAAHPRAQPGADPWPGRFAQVLAETLAGARTSGQIDSWTTVAARRRIRQLGPMLTASVAPRVRRIVLAQPASRVVEMAVVVDFGSARLRALAVRLERRPAPPGWVCTAVDVA